MGVVRPSPEFREALGGRSGGRCERCSASVPARSLSNAGWHNGSHRLTAGVRVAAGCRRQWLWGAARYPMSFTTSGHFTL